VKLLALDFDGVVSDSAPEALAVALATYAELWPRSALARAALGDAGPSDPRRAPTREAATRHPLYPGFLALMPLGNRAEDYAVVLEALEEEAAVPDQAAYDARRARWSDEALARFHERFYARRRALAEGDPQGWHALIGPYPRLPAILRRRAGEVVLAIATAKDRGSVRALLRAYGLDDLFDARRLLDKETGVSKTAHLERLHAEQGVPYGEMVFVDDKVNHLDRVAALGVRCALAAWGYNGEREIALARDHGHLVCRLESFEAQLFGARGGSAGAAGGPDALASGGNPP